MDATQRERAALELRRLERRRPWLWALVGLLLAALAAAVALLGAAGPGAVAATDGGATAVVGLAGLVALFSLYMILAQRRVHALKTRLFEAAVQEEALRSRLAALAALFEGIAHLGVPFELDSMLQTLTEHLRASLGADRSSLLLVDPESGELRGVAAAGRDAQRAREARHRLGEGISGWVAAHGRPLALDRETVALRFPESVRPAREIATGLCVPLSIPGRVIGVLNVTRIERDEPFTEEDARVVGVFAAHIAVAIRGVHERRRAQEALREQEEQLRQSQKMESLGRLAGGVAHDFNNLLMVILSYGAKLLRGTRPEDPMRQCAERICDAADRCAALTRHLLTFSRRQLVEMKVLDLNQCVQSMSDLLRRLIGENVELVTDLDPAAGRVLADAHQIQQVLMNLVVNARDALPVAGRVTISTSNLALDGAAAARHAGARTGDYVVLAVRDTGHGMDAATQAQAFEPFFTTKDQGTGLGLSTVYGVVQQCGGFIAVDSRPGHGTTFRIALPRVEAALPAPAAPPAAPAAPGRGMVLVVEDEDEVRRLVRETLERHGYQVLAAAWAGEAVLMAEAHPGPIDLMLTDVVMPGESGGELAQWMAQARPEMPVLFMSGYSDDALVRHGVEERGAAFLPKPFTEEALLERVAAMLEARRAA